MEELSRDCWDVFLSGHFYGRPSRTAPLGTRLLKSASLTRLGVPKR